MADFTKAEIKKMVEDAVQEAISETLVTAITASVAQSIKCSVDNALAAALKDYEHECVLDLDTDELKAIRKLADIAASLGEHGNIKDGVEEIRANHTFLKDFRRKAEKAGGAMLMAIVSAVVGIFLVILGIGAKVYFKIGGPGS